ncbi:MgtC/SapB family protein [Candidatus Parcubacteria bacterium]|nr:MAG: MgtC/SapB family protein [Candidatus Parcubacteria bacterium]
MLDLTQMVGRLLLALVLGALMGLERELIGKEAGIRTGMLVSGGAAVFAIVAITLPYLIAVSSEHQMEVIARNSGFLAIIANVVVGIGFLGAGIIIKQDERVKGLTTAAVVWTTAAIGTLAGLGLHKFAVSATVLIAGLLYLLKDIAIYEQAPPPPKPK